MASGFFLQDERRKPDRWGFDHGLVDPKWNWFWEKSPIAIPVWEGGGDSIFAGQPARTTHTIASSEGPTWGLGPHDIALIGDNPASTTQTDVWDTGIPVPSGVPGITCIAGVFVGDASTDRYIHILSDGEVFNAGTHAFSFGFRPNFSTGMRMWIYGRNTGTLVGSESKVSDFFTVPTSGGFYATLCSTMNGARVRHFYFSDAGASGTKTTATSWTITPSGSNVAFLGAPDGMSTTSSGLGRDGIDKIRFAYCFFEELPDFQIKEIAHDPFGPFRRTERVKWLSIAAAAGGPKGPFGHPLHGPFAGPIGP